MEYTKDYLAHHGIKGQKWGVRRYQNEDGTLTAAGEKRYYVNANGDIKKRTGSMKRAQKTYERVHSVRDDAKRMSRMSDRQKQSLESAENYWKSKAEGEKPEERRNIVKRHYDKTRSFNKYERAGREALRQISTKATYQNQLPNDARTKKGQVISSAMEDTMKNIIMDEIYNKAFGHF